MPLFGIFVPYLRGMKQNAEESVYRPMNEVQLKYELIKIENHTLDITGDPTDYKHSCPFLVLKKVYRR